jgi:hypothetical protein
MRLHIDPSGGVAHRADHRPEIVLASGVVTTALALAGVLALAHRGTNVMGWYANYVIPAGALVVGACAASGFAIGAWLTGLKMTRRLVVAVVALLAVSYFVAQYEEYRATGFDIGFWTWFDMMARAFAWKHKNGTIGEPFGAAGYLFRGLEIGGFVLGGMLVPLGLRNKPYCESCRTYRRSKLVSLVPMFPQDAATDPLAEMYKTAHAGDRAAFERVVEENGSLRNKRKARTISPRIAVYRVRCPRCASGGLAATKLQRNGRQLTRSVLPEQPLDGDKMRALFDRDRHRYCEASPHHTPTATPLTCVCSTNSLTPNCDDCARRFTVRCSLSPLLPLDLSSVSSSSGACFWYIDATSYATTSKLAVGASL